MYRALRDFEIIILLTSRSKLVGGARHATYIHIYYVLQVYLRYFKLISKKYIFDKLTLRIFVVTSLNRRRF